MPDLKSSLESVLGSHAIAIVCALGLLLVLKVALLGLDLRAKHHQITYRFKHVDEFGKPPRVPGKEGRPGAKR
jgi:hypothetical protein